MSCWELYLNTDGSYSEPRSYLINPGWWDENYLLDFNYVAAGTFPAMYGGWMCQPPMEVMETVYVDCMRFLPSKSYSNTTDVRFETGPVTVWTYLTSRTNSTDIFMEENSTFEEFNVDLAMSGAWSGISAVGVALASIALLAF